MAGILDRIYAVSPVWVQQIGVTAFGFVWNRRRFGGRFQAEAAAFAERESYTPEQWRNYQARQLHGLLTYAATRVPYYREKWAELGLSVSELSALDPAELHRLPILPKDDIRSQPERFVGDDVNQKKLHTYLTSGTTGTPLAVKNSNAVQQTVAAVYETRCRRWAGVNYKMSRAMIGGRLVVTKAESKPPFWRYNAAERQLYMSAFHISPATAKDYVQALNEYKPDYLVGYASAHFFLARMIVELGLQAHQPKAIMTSSEKLTPEMRSVLEQAYRCEVFDAYSGVEWCALASECEHHRLHLSPDVGIVELVDEDGMPVAPGEPGEIVATGLLNFVQPLIRYRTGDRAILSTAPCPCGRQMPVLEELVGRLEDVVIGRDGREMVRFHGIFVGLPHVREGQVIQETLTDFRIRLVVDPAFDDEDRAAIDHRFEQRLGPINLNYEFVDEIERTERGKFRAVISKVKRVPAGSELQQV